MRESRKEREKRGEKSLLIRAFGSSPKLRIIDFFLDNKLFDFSKKEIIEETGMSKSTFYKYWDEFMEFELVKENREFGKTVLYTLNKEDPIVQKLMEIEQKLIEKSAEISEKIQVSA